MTLFPSRNVDHDFNCEYYDVSGQLALCFFQ